MPRKKNTTRSDGRIAVQVYIGRNDDGKRKYKTVYGATQKEADEKARQVKIAMGKGIDVSADRDTFGYWADQWADVKSTEVSSGMMIAYRSAIKHLAPLRNIPICKVRTADIQPIISKLAQLNPTTGKPSSKRTLETVRITASQIFEMAINNRVIDYNPARAICVPSEAPKKAKRALTQEEQHWILDTPHRAQLPAMIMLFAGLRRGEVIPLTWRDIDLDAATIQVSKSAEMINGHAEIKQGAKSSAGVRTIYIPDILVDFLRLQPKKSILVCPSAHGDLMGAEAWKRMWESYLRDLNAKYGDFTNCLNRPKSKYDPRGIPMMIPRFTAHWLRHTFATMLYLSGVDVLTAKEQLGHADVKTTMDIYTHLDQKYKKRSMNKLNEYLVNASQMQVKAE